MKEIKRETRTTNTPKKVVIMEMRNPNQSAIDTIVSLAKAEIEKLKDFVSDLTFEQAFKRLDGFNLECDITTIGPNREYVGMQMRFDCNINHICATIFNDGKGGCEVYEDGCDYYVNDSDTPLQLSL